VIENDKKKRRKIVYSIIPEMKKMNVTEFIDFIVKKSLELATTLNIYDDTRAFTKLLKDKKNLVGAEIGVKNGKNSLSFLRNLDIKMLYGVDPYSKYDGYDELWFNNLQESFDNVERDAYDRLRIFHRRFKFVKEFSVNAAKIVSNNLDFVYIDGNHAYDYVKQDIEDWYPKVKSGGIIGGHDFFNMGNHDGVHKAVIEFAVNNNLALFFKNPDWWVYK